MKNIYLLSLLALILVSTLSCMRFKTDRSYHYTPVEMVENRKDGGTEFTVITYREWGRGAGLDELFGTSDDDIYSYTKTNLDETGKLISVKRVGPSIEYGFQYTGDPTRYQGPDGIWFTNDDIGEEMVKYSKSDNKETWLISKPLTDPVWTTALNDVVNPPSWRQRVQVGLSDTHGEQTPPFFGNPVFTSIFSSMPNNEKYLSQIDYYSYHAGRRVTRIRTNDGFEVRSFTNDGEDGRGSVINEIPHRYWRVTKVGKSCSIIESVAGVDRTFGTSDDTLVYGIFLQLNDSGEIQSGKLVTDFGSDKVPFNDDDTYLLIVETKRVQNGTEVREITHSRRPIFEPPAPIGASIDALKFESTQIEVFDSSFLPGMWTGSKETLSGSKRDALWYVSRDVASLSEKSGIDNVREVEFFRGKLDNCIPTDIDTLEPCASAFSKLNMSKYAGRTLERIASDAVQLTWDDGFVMVGISSSQKLIQVDRSGSQ